MSAPIIQPIPNYINFFINNVNRKLYGFTDSGLVNIEIKNNKEVNYTLLDFFVIDQIIYFSISVFENTGTENEIITYFYRQENGIVSVVDDFPNEPEQTHSRYESENWEIVIDKYQDEPISKAFNLFFKGSAVFKQISGYYETPDGLYLNVVVSQMPGKREGLYFFPLRRTSVSFVAEAGKVW